MDGRRAHKGKTYEEIYGPERADEERRKRFGPGIARLLRHSSDSREKTYEEIYGPERAVEERKKRSGRAGKTWEEIYGVEKAEEIRFKRWGIARGHRSSSGKYREWRQAVLERDSFTCQDCGKVSESNCAHHIFPRETCKNLRFDVGNGMTLCRSCHTRRHNLQRGRRVNQELVLYVVRRIAIAHFLPDYPGLCSHLHGHSLKIESWSRGPIDSVTGMVADFADIKTVIDEFDHTCLNDHFENPTAEHLALYFFEHIPNCVKIRVWESENCYAEVQSE